MSVLALIPARFASSRLPGKPLVEIAGKPMIQHVYERVRSCGVIDRVAVATDDQRIYDRVLGFGGAAVMTSDRHASGTDRIAEAADILGGAAIIVNVQGDEPMIDPSLLEALVTALNQSNYDCATPITRIHSTAEMLDPNVVKVVLRSDMTPLYFSRSPIPFVRDHDPETWLEAHAFHRHIGVYAYRQEALKRFVAASPSSLERAEQLEQLRMFDLGMSIVCVETAYRGISVDTPEDVVRAESLMA